MDTSLKVLDRLSDFFLNKHTRYDTILTILSGIVSVIGSICFIFSHKTAKFRQIVSYENYDMLRFTLWIILLVGIASIIIGVIKLVYGRTKRLKRYIPILVILLIFDFIIGIALTEYKNRVNEDLSRRMYEQVTERRKSDQQFGVGFGIAENWDYMQVYFKCCGVESYKDYTSGVKGGNVPDSCCVMNLGAQTVENIHQCQHDAKRNVHDSVFLNARGCHVPLTAWFLRHIATLSAIAFAAISLQAVAVLFVSWKGFMYNTQFKDEEYSSVSKIH